MIVWRFLLLFIVPVCLTHNYAEESPSKLLVTKYFGPRYEASNSNVRLSLEGGLDEPVPDLEDLEVANDLPKDQLVLNPGGKVVYALPVIDENGRFDHDLIYVMVKPGKKDPPPLMSNPFTDKADLTIFASSDISGAESVNISCSVPNNHRSSLASEYCILPLEPIINQISSTVVITIKVPDQETRNAVLWQVQLSSLQDSARIKGIFQNEARSLFRKTQSYPEYNTWLTLVSCVGKTGVGKSTVASLISGNDTMFVAKSSSHGTTTLGADVSTIIPAKDYRVKLEGMLDTSIAEPSANHPLFLIDSEGMAFRGDEVDFVNTGPVAIIANIIVWITEGRMRPQEILDNLRDYLKGLDRISLSNETSQTQDYGQFIVVLNKMQETDEDDTNEELCSSLLAWGQSDENDDTIAEMYARFKEISCIGFPLVQLEEGEDFGYGVIKRYPRFVDGIKTIADKLIAESELPKDVRVGETIYQMNSTNAETIIGLIIDGANQGNIDLTEPCNVLYSLFKEQVIQEIEKLNTELEDSTGERCDSQTLACSACVCDYRTTSVNAIASQLLGIVTSGMVQAETLCFDRPEVKLDISSLIDEKINPWKNENICSEISDKFESSRICDISELQVKFDEESDREITIDCETLHMCGETVIHNSKITFNTDKAYIAPGFQMTQEAPKRPRNGENSLAESGDGEDGQPGGKGKDIILSISKLLTSSETLLIASLEGGDGSDGGKGGDGRSASSGGNGINGKNGVQGANGIEGEDGKNFYPKRGDDLIECEDIAKENGTLYGEKTEKDIGQHECWGPLGSHCREFFDYQHRKFTRTATSDCNQSETNGLNGSDGEPGGDGTNGTSGKDATQSTKGGNGGNGGSGGEAGIFTLQTNTALKVKSTKKGGKGGYGGEGGFGGLGAEGGKKGYGGSGGKGGKGGKGGEAGKCFKQVLSWDCIDIHITTGHCEGVFGEQCNVHRQYSDCNGFTLTEEPETSIEGNPGEDGNDGADGKNGVDGLDGKNAEKQPDGNKGTEGTDAEFVTLMIY